MTDRVRRLDRGEVTPEAREIFDLYERERGNVPNMQRTMAHRPEYLRTMITHFRTVMKTGTVPERTKEIVVVRVSHLNRCGY